jgi:cyclopropane fatty-acyl-phospholipid synthase-like methyltransferase
MSQLERDIAVSMDADPVLIPFLPELFADLDELGSSADQIVDVLAPLKLPRAARVLELGCGKGVVAVRLAREFGFSVLAVDGIEPFIEGAASRAKKAGVENRCEFRCADLRQTLSDSGQFDLVMMIGVGPVLGDQAATIGALRDVVRPGGCMLIDDAYLLPGVQATGPLETYVEHDETIRRLTSHGDELIREATSTPEEMTRNCTDILESIRRRADRLTRTHPKNEALFRAYVATQEGETERMPRTMVFALWLLRRAV